MQAIVTGNIETDIGPGSRLKTQEYIEYQICAQDGPKPFNPGIWADRVIL